MKFDTRKQVQLGALIVGLIDLFAGLKLLDARHLHAIVPFIMPLGFVLLFTGIAIFVTLMGSEFCLPKRTAKDLR